MRKIHRTEIKFYCVKKCNKLNKMKMLELRKYLSSKWKKKWLQNLVSRPEMDYRELIFSVNFLNPSKQEGD
jgi:hypothetical protein